jgi:hypothetical protein
MSAENTVYSATGTCKGCGAALLPQAKRTFRPKEFCADRCRTAWHLRERRRKLELAYRLLSEVLGEP